MTGKVAVAGIPVVAVNLECAVNLILNSARQEANSFHLANAYTFSLASRNSKYFEILTGGQVLPDGKPLSIIVRLRNNLARQIRGPSLFESCLASQDQKGVSHFFLGSTQNVLNSITAKIQAEYSSAIVAGTFSPPFSAASARTIEEQDKIIKESGANLIWVGLGTPKQDYEAARISKELGITCVAIGAAFDFFSGHKAESPVWIRSIGLEWMFRLFSEPKRLWKRYLIGNFLFLWRIIRRGLK